MKKMLIAMLVMVFAFAGTNALACDGPECQNFVSTDIQTDIYTPPLNYYVEGSNGGEDSAYMGGAAGYSHDIRAEGSLFSYANGNGQGDMYGFGGAFQKEINQGELSGAGALTIGVSQVDGYALGVDAPWCNNGDDFAKVDLEVKGTVIQENQAYSDDRDSFIGGGNFSRVDYWGQTDKYDYGPNQRVWDYGWYRDHRGRWQYGWHRETIVDLTAEAHDSLYGVGITGGGTLVYAKQTDTSAFVGGITGNFGTALYCGAEHTQTDVYGDGYIGGAAQLPGVGYSAFNANFTYSGQDFGAGVAGGMSQVEISQSSNHTSVTSTASAFAGAISGGGNGRNYDIPQ